MAQIPEKPQTNLEQYLNRIATGEGEYPAEPHTNVEQYLNYIIENGTGGGEIVTELPAEGKDGRLYVLVDDAENPTKAYGVYTYAGGQYILVAQPVDQAVQKVTELPETGEEGILYYLEKEGEEDTYDLYRWINDEWIKVDTDIKLYDSTGINTDGAMTQNAVTSMVFKDPATRRQVRIGNANYSQVMIGHYYTPSTPDSMNCIVIGGGSQASSASSGGIAIDGTVRGNCNGGIAIGGSSFANGWGAVALGYGSSAAGGTVSINTSNSNMGYNRSNYRLLTGVYDGQSAHDAATFGQVVSYSAINGAGAPTTATEGKYVGQLYYDTTNEDMYFLKAIDTTTDPVTYTWEELAGGPVVVQTTGTSTTDVMSQNAVTSMVFKDPATKYNVQIGAGSSVSDDNGVAIGRSVNVGGSSVGIGYLTKIGQWNNAQGVAIGSQTIAGINQNDGQGQVAIGASAEASSRYSSSSNSSGAVSIGFHSKAASPNSVALGAYSRAYQRGEVAIGVDTSAPYYATGYNGSEYRLLTGLYDPQSDHDAATKGYVDTQAPAALTDAQYNALWSNPNPLTRLLTTISTGAGV